MIQDLIKEGDKNQKMKIKNQKEGASSVYNKGATSRTGQGSTRERRPDDEREKIPNEGKKKKKWLWVKLLMAERWGEIFEWREMYEWKGLLCSPLRFWSLFPKEFSGWWFFCGLGTSKLLTWTDFVSSTVTVLVLSSPSIILKTFNFLMQDQLTFLGSAKKFKWCLHQL